MRVLMIISAVIAGIIALVSLPKKSTPVAAVSTTAEENAIRTARKAKEDADEAIFQRDVAAVRILRKSMKNPASFQLEEALRMNDGAICLTYRATNAFNAIVPGQAVIVVGEITTSDTQAEFVKAWKSHCAGKRGADITYLRRAL